MLTNNDYQIYQIKLIMSMFNPYLAWTFNVHRKHIGVGGKMVTGC